MINCFLVPLRRRDNFKCVIKKSWWIFRTLLDESLSFGTPSLACAIMNEGCQKRKLEDDGGNQKNRKKTKQETKALKAKRPGFTEERYNETSYYVENGLRKVYPYYFTFTTFCKGRWVGRPILEVFAKEFRAHPPEEYERCIKTGTLTVNYKIVEIDYKLQHNDLLANTVHRHEVPVANHPIRILHECEDLIVVDKPPSIPVHPCGRYRHNSVVFILAKEFNLKNLRTIHRLDRLTSGLLLFGRTVKKARQLEHEIRSRLVSKEYVCRVEGQFPSEPITCEEPIEVVSYKIGVCRVGPKGKECKTEFQCLSYNGTTSVVLCKPRTGRMHQIRVHLQFLGYPIINDPLYNHSVFGPEKGKGGNIGKTNEMLIAELINIHNAENWLGMDSDNEEFSLAKALPDSLVEVPAIATSKSAGGKPPVPLEVETPDCAAENVKVEPVGPLEGDVHLRISSSTTEASSVQRQVEASNEDDTQSVLRKTVKDPLIQREVEASNEDDAQSVPRNTVKDPLVQKEVDASNEDDAQSVPRNTVEDPLVQKEVDDSNEDDAQSVPGKAVKDPLVQKEVEASNENDAQSVPRKAVKDPLCYECKVKFRDPSPEDLVMFLHAWTYKGPGWSYETQLPAWASEDWQETTTDT